MPVSEIDVDELGVLDTTSIQLINMHEPDEYAEARVPGARLVPLMAIPDHLAELDKSRTLYLICASGGRSMNAAQFLDEYGFDAVNIAGGTKSWVAAGKPYESGSPAS